MQLTNLRYVVELALVLHAGHVEQGLQALQLGVQGQLVVLRHHPAVTVLRAGESYCRVRMIVC